MGERGGGRRLHTSAVERGRQPRRAPTPCPPPASLSCARSPKRFPLPLHVLVGPILPLVTSVFTWLGDRAARRYNGQHGLQSRAAGGANK